MPARNGVLLTSDSPWLLWPDVLSGARTLRASVL
jgi:hypothetical protein